MSFPFDLNKFYSIQNDSTYHNIDALSSSQLKDLSISSKHWDAAKRTRTITDAMRFGSAYHAAMLEPEAFKARLKLKPEWDARTKEGKALRDQFNLSVTDADFVLSEAELRDLNLMKEVLDDNQDWHRILNKAQHIESFAVVDVNVGKLLNLGEDVFVRCKFKPDIVLKNGVIVDLKTTKCAHPNALIGEYGTIRKEKYNAQIAWYTYLNSLITGLDIPNYGIIVAQEKEDPFCESIITLDSNDLEEGWSFVMQGLFNYVRFLELKKLQGYDYSFDFTILD